MSGTRRDAGAAEEGGPAVELRTRVEWIDTDAAGIYHNSSVIRFVEAAEAELMRSCGIEDYFPVAPRVRFEADFEAPLFFGQEVTVQLRVARLGRSSLTFAFEIWGERFRGEPRRRAARGTSVTAHLPGRHSTDGRSAPWPADWRERLERGVPPR